MTKYKSYRIIYGKPRWIVIDETNNIINKKPNKEELKELKEEPYNKDIRKKYTKEELINYLKDFIIKYKKPPTIEEFRNNPDYPSPTTYKNYFGSWNDAITKVGLNINRGGIRYSDRELLDTLRLFYLEYGRIPTRDDFENNFEYPSATVYVKHFGNWSNALKLVDFDIDSIVKKGILKNNLQKGRLGEILIRDHFKIYPIDLAGENCLSHCDGVCPNGKFYDVKSSKLYNSTRKHYNFKTTNKYKEEIEIYYFLAFNENWTKLDYAWRVPGEIVDKDYFQVGLNHNYKFNIKNMEEYNITEELRKVLTKYGFFKS